MSKRKAKCPYYKSERPGCILCRMPGRKREVTIGFSKYKHRKKYKRAFCCDTWLECVVARALALEEMEKDPY